MRSRKRRASWHLLRLEERITPAVAYALSNNALIAFDTASPSVTQVPIPVTGLNGETLVGIDFRPQNGMLYGLTSNGVGVKLYAISHRTGTATALTTDFQQFDDGAGNLVPVVGTQFGFDFNPAADRIRVVTNAGGNFRVNPNTGLIIDGNDTTPGVNPDGNLAVNGTLTGGDGSAYTNNQPNTSITTLYTLDATTDRLYLQNPPNSGALNTGVPVTVNGQPLDFTAVNGFDIPTGVNAPASNEGVVGDGFAVLQVGGQTRLYRIGLSGGVQVLIIPRTDGVATLVGTVGDGTFPVQGFAIQSELTPGGLPAVALAANNSLVRFVTTANGGSSQVTLGSLNAGESLVGIDYRPATGQLYGLVYNGSGVRLVIIDPQTGALVDVGGNTPRQFDDGAGGNIMILGTAFGIDFNPTVDLLRVVTDARFNFRINPVTGALIDGDGGLSTPQPGVNPDGGLNGGSISGDGTAYTNSFAGSAATTLYTIDAATNSIYLQNAPNSGTLTNGLPIRVNGAVLDFDAVNGFDIPAGVRVSSSNSPAAGRAVAALRVGGITGLYLIDLATGAATPMGAVSANTVPLVGLALGDAPAGSVQFVAPTFATREGATSATLDLVRVGGSVGNLTVVIAATSGSAIPGIDYSGLPITVTFADGQTTASVPLTLLDDNVLEGNKTVVLALSADGFVVGPQSTAVLTILEDDTPPIGAFSIGGAVTTTNADNSTRLSIRPFPNFGGAVTIAQGDVNGDTVPDVIAGAGPGGGPHVKVFDGATGQEIASFFAFDPGFRGGIFVTASDVTGDGRADIVVGAGAGGGPHVRVFDAIGFGEIRSFFAFADQFLGGVRVAGGDVNSDGIGDIVVAAGAGGGPHVRAVSGVDGSELLSFFAYDPQFTGGVFLGSGDINGDGFQDVITGAGTSPHVTVISGQTGQPIRSFFAYESQFAGGVRVASNDLNADGTDDIVTGPGPGTVPRVRTFDSQTLSLINEITLSDPTLFQGVFVG